MFMPGFGVNNNRGNFGIGNGGNQGFNFGNGFNQQQNGFQQGNNMNQFMQNNWQQKSSFPPQAMNMFNNQKNMFN